MPRSSSYTYNPTTGSWDKTSADTGSGSSSNSSSSNTSGSSPSGTSTMTSSSSNQDTSTGKTEKEYNTIEINTLSGTLNFIVTKETIKLKAGDTVKLKGLGKYLSGSYYVQDVTRQISSNGYSHSATLIKTDFGKSLKLTTSTTAKKPVEKPKPVPSTPKASTAGRTYTVKKGDSLWAIAAKMYGSGAKWQDIYNANVGVAGKPYTKGGTTYSMIYPGQVLTIP